MVSEELIKEVFKNYISIEEYYIKTTIFTDEEEEIKKRLLNKYHTRLALLKSVYYDIFGYEWEDELECKSQKELI